MDQSRTYESLQEAVRHLSQQLQEANDTIEAIRTGQVDAIIVNDPVAGDKLYTLKSADQTYRVFIEQMNEGAVTLDRQGTVLYCNSMFARMVGTPLSDIVGSSLKSFIAENCLQLFEELIHSGWENDKKLELSIRQHNKIIPCQLSVATLELDGRESLSVIVTDLSFQKDIQKLLKENNRRLEEANQQLEASNHDLQQFASVASHDMQEPLRKILIFSNLLATSYGNEITPEIRTYLDKISASSMRMRSMVSDILKYSRLSSQQAAPQLFGINELIREIEDDYELLIEEKNVELILGELPVVEGNRSQIKQVFQNLISNSIKFASAHTHPVIKIYALPAEEGAPGDVAPAHALCRIVVEDNGIGFDMKYGEKIFSLFERLNNKESYEGSGIGLSITKKIIERHGGTISAESREGAGACFTIAIPLRQNLPDGQEAPGSNNPA
ncbi:sensor histidine kinase [Dyadobacter sandarakinus]|uniref:histidine kinase n=1 Tax=Dyadobacter sandarakinus TaxID=2747268 RepID=A0ABX7I2H0_9BACT|nr:ATP-binding protein [Dyadobacter sandarakinus]QRR00249.1 PAS domain-containing protein [Dyadobacter sandarakinus]